MIVIPHLIEHFKHVDQEIDFSSIETLHQDIEKINSCHIKGVIRRESNNFFIDFKVDVNLTLLSTRTLKPIDYEFSFPLELIIGSHEEADFALSDQIELDKIIYGHIILEKPLSIYDEDEEVYVDKTKRVNPFFEELKDIKF